MKLPLKWLPAKAFGGLFRRPAPSFVVVHSTESENTPAIAESLAGPNWFGGPKAGTSTHKIVDVDSICEGVRRDRVAYHAGPGGNTYGIAYEFCGRASWSAAKWREPAQLQMLRNAAPHIADDLIAITGSVAEARKAARWLSLVQVARHEVGLCTHNDCRLAFPGTTTHSDPGPNFPYAELMQMVQDALGAGKPPVVGAIAAAYNRIVLPPRATWAFFLGAAKGPEVPTWDKAGRWQEFAKGIIMWHPVIGAGVAHIVWGAILKRFWALGAEPVVGYPVTDELACPDTVGRMSHFQGGPHGPSSIYWTPKTGAHPVWGLFRRTWAAAGWERGLWGYPTSGEYLVDGVVVQDFAGGRVSLVEGRAFFEPKR